MTRSCVLPDGSIVAKLHASKEGIVPALLPVLLLGSQVVLAADRVPQLDFTLSCKSAGTGSLMGPSAGTRNAQSCEQDERDARNKLDQVWTSYAAPERDRCTRLSTLGGSPSYVELLTCLEIAKAAQQLPAADRMGDGERVGR